MSSPPDVTPHLTETPLGDSHFPMELRFPSDVRYIERVVGTVVEGCTFNALPPHHCSLNVPVALTEALANAIAYGNGDDATKEIRVRASLSERSLVLEVEDEGAGFDIEACTIDPTSEANLLREDGRGLFLMQSLMDRVERFSERGNVIRLTLHRT